MVNKLAEKYTIQEAARPFLKWAGGKSQLLNRFEDFYPEELKKGIITNYYEPFLGSGAVFFDIARKYRLKKAYLFDVNEDLILTYKVIKRNVDELTVILHELSEEYCRLSPDKRKSFYYQVRQEYNESKSSINYNRYSRNWTERAARIIFLNRTCFNGLFRVNSSGFFNSPAGEYNKPKICDEKNLRAVSKALSIAEIKRADFSELAKLSAENGFIYFDPPYRPISKTSSFRAYSSTVFDDARQKQLSELFKRLAVRKHKVMLSNSDPRNFNPEDNFFDELYRGYAIYRVPARRLINSNPLKRGPVSEIIITSY